jgi:hypothetical protein
MNPDSIRLRFANHTSRVLMAFLCALLLVPGDSPGWALGQEPKAATTPETAPKIPNDQLDSLVAPIALYPDPLLAQVLAASTYPLEIIQLQQWLEKNKDLKGQALTDAVMKQGWDPSVQAMAPLPEVVKRLADDIKWTTDLGNAFLAQQSDVMDAVQRMRKKAKDTGNLKSNEQQKVETQVVENKTVIVVQQASPEVVYVPSYNPVVVYGPPVYPYPPIYYPPPGYYAAGMAISFGIGVAMGAAWGGGWGWGCGWGHNDVNINVNNNYVNHYNRQNVNNQIGSGNNTWQHNSQHRGGAPYADRSTANKYGGTARGDPMSTRQANARQNQARSGGQPQAGTMDRGGAGAGASRGGASASNMSTNRSAGGGDRVGNRSVPSSSGSRSSSAFGGASTRTSGSAARASSSRGASSMGARGGGRRR